MTPCSQRLIVEIEVALARTALAIDASFAGRATAEITLAELHALMRLPMHHLVIKQATIAAVDAATTASGGAGYLRSNPISRYYGDVRADRSCSPTRRWRPTPTSDGSPSASTPTWRADLGECGPAPGQDDERLR